MDDYDLDDPTLERFPSNREEILETVRKIESGLNEDRASLEGVPPSPLVGPGRRSSNDFSVDHFLISPSVSPTIRRSVRRLDIPHGSKTPERSSSLASLHSIVEETGPDEEAERQPIILLPGANTSLSASGPKSSTSDEDEGVELGGPKRAAQDDKSSPGFLTPERAASPAPPDSPKEPAPNKSIPIPLIETQDLKTARSLDEDDNTTILRENIRAESPSIVIHRPDTPGGQDGDGFLLPGPHEAPAAEAGSKDTSREADSSTSAVDMATPNSVKARPGQLTKRVAGTLGSRAGTPASIHSTGIDAAKSGNWFTAFFRLVFVEWIGGFISRLCGRRHKV